MLNEIAGAIFGIITVVYIVGALLALACNCPAIRRQRTRCGLMTARDTIVVTPR